MVLLFLRDWRSAIIVLLNIPLALMAAIVALWLTGQTINLMTLGGLALAIGILVDEATVEIENIHSQMSHAPSIARAVRLGNAQTAIPRFLAMVCILAVFISSFFMQGAPRAMFVPLSAIVRTGKQASCWTVQNAAAARTPITLGLQVGNELEVTSGLKGDELVVQSQGESLREGQTVKVAETTTP